MRCRILVTFCFWSSLLVWAVSFVWAATPKAIHEEGIIEFEDGLKIELAGIHLTSEGIRMLPALIAGREVKIDEAGDPAKSAVSGAIKGYLFTKVQEMEMDGSANEPRAEKKIMINEILLDLGAASVDLSSDSKYKKLFLEKEQIAKDKGYGIWSYGP